MPKSTCTNSKFGKNRSTVLSLYGAAIKVSGNRFKTLAESSNSAIFIIRGDRFVYVNPAMTAITGFSEQELFSMDFWEVVHPGFMALVKKRKLARRNRQVPLSRYETRLIGKSGEERWVDLSLTVLQLDGDTVLLGTAFDISKRRNAEEALRGSERKYRLLVENVADIICIREIETHRLQYITPSVQRLRGFSVKEALTLTPSEDLTPPSLSLSRDALESLIACRQDGSRHAFRVLELEYRCKDGSTLWTESTLSLLRDEEGNVEGLLGVSREISARKGPGVAIGFSHRP